MFSFKRLFGACLAGAVVVAGLGLGQSAQASTDAVTPPKRIISLSPSATEILWGIGAAKQVIAVDDNSNFPAGVPTTKLSSFTPNVEALAVYKPDLVILQANATKATDVQGALKKLGIKVFLEQTPNNLSQALAEFRALGAATGHVAQAAKLAASVKGKIAAIVTRLSVPKTRAFIELDNTLYSATSKTFLGGVLKAFGAINIADAAGKVAKSDYPQLSSEALLAENPQVILLTDSEWGESKATVSARAGWNTVDAVRFGKIFAINGDIASRWGPRLVDLYAQIGDALAHVK
jgi:iron complex transport system substrate-binding protein